MPSAVYLHDGEHQITVTFRTEQDRERFKAHYRTLDALGVQYRDERDDARRANERLAGEVAALEAAVRDLWRKVPDYKMRDLDVKTIGIVNKATSPFAAAPPPAGEDAGGAP